MLEMMHTAAFPLATARGDDNVLVREVVVDNRDDVHSCISSGYSV